ncbi:MAG: hypothetical protein JSW26_23120 [Desulfobacterales bacterium]|nr:MAG: hypothetical protein JSW26_23120 [Desulfobacterales bacterium]
MFRWHYINSKYMYVGIQLMSTALAFSKGLTPSQIIFANPTLPYGGLSIASKTKILARFQNRRQFLCQQLIPQTMNLDDRKKLALSFLETNTYPIIAKPDRGVVGIGVRKIDCENDLDDILHIMPSDYMLQEYCDYPLEYGIFFCKFPDEPKGSVVSLTEKIAPFVIGDGSRSVRQLVKINPDFKFNKIALMSHARNLDYIPQKGERYQVVIQGSHTYGSIFKDRNDRINEQLESWLNELCTADDQFYFGRFDMKVKDEEALNSGSGVKIIELNGCWSEPIHIYDDRHGVLFAFKELFYSYARAYHIAKLNKKSFQMKASLKDLLAAYRVYLQEKEQVIRVVG